METAQTPSLAALVLRAHILSGSAEDLTAWFVKMMMRAAAFPGFLSAEILPSISKVEPAWFLVEWFRTEAELATWQASPEREELKQELDALFPEGSLTLLEEITDQAGTRGSVATAIITEVKPGSEKEYHDWATKIKLSQTRYPGYRGTYYQPPMDEKVDQWTTLLRFDTPENLDNWFDSDERNKLLSEGLKFIKSTDFHRLPVSSFPGWFPVDKKSGRSPSRWKTAMLVLLSLYPLAVLQFQFVRPVLVPLPPSVITFICNLTSVMIMSWLLMPFAVKKFDTWLYCRDDDTKSNIKGLAILVGLYVLEIACFLFLLKH